MSGDDLRCKRALMHLVEAERDMTCIEVHVRGMKQLLPQIDVGELEELLMRISAKLEMCQNEVFCLSRDGIPSSLMH